MKHYQLLQRYITGKFILKQLKRKLDSGEIFKGQKKKDMLNILRQG